MGLDGPLLLYTRRFLVSSGVLAKEAGAHFFEAALLVYGYFFGGFWLFLSLIGIARVLASWLLATVSVSGD